MSAEQIDHSAIKAGELVEAEMNDGARVRGFVTLDGYIVFADAEGEESRRALGDTADVRPLVVIDPATVEAKRPGLAAALAGHAHRVVERDGMSHSGDTTETIDQILAHLGIEVAR